MAATLRLEIVTPEATAYSEDVEMVTLPGTEGELGVYPNHVPLLTTLNPGELRVLKGGRETFLAVGEGFVEIKADAVSVLTDLAIEASQIDLGAAEAAVARAQAAMKEDHGAEGVVAIQAGLQKALAQLHVKRRRHP
ncbi:MAG: F0F1 ATP synthase subunit epsilon [Chthoniobacterales bacterium]